MMIKLFKGYFSALNIVGCSKVQLARPGFHSSTKWEVSLAFAAASGVERRLSPVAFEGGLSCFACCLCTTELNLRRTAVVYYVWTEKVARASGENIPRITAENEVLQCYLYFSACKAEGGTSSALWESIFTILQASEKKISVPCLYSEKAGLPGCSPLLDCNAVMV